MRVNRTVREFAARLPRRVTACLFGITLAASLVLFIEAVFWVLVALEPKPHIRHINASQRPHSVARGALWLDGVQAYDVRYTHDARGLRISPDNPDGEVDRHINFFGGSFTYGTGVEDHETLPNQVARLWPGTYVENLASDGHGTLHVYESIDLIDRSMLGDFNGRIIGVYGFIPHHVHRNIGTMRLVNTWGADFPYYRFDDQGNLVKLGTFADSRPVLTTIQKLLHREKVMQYFGVDLPRIGARHIEFTVCVIEKTKEKFANATGSDEFCVLMFPTPTQDTHGAYFKALLAERGIDVLDYSGLLDPDAPPYALHGDPHVTGEAYQEIARALVNDLRNPTTD